MKMRIALLGPTASGKSQFALQLAPQINAQIVSLDSTALYQGFDIGSAKPSVADRKLVLHHLVDHYPAHKAVSTFEFVNEAQDVMQNLEEKNITPLIVGGTYFYLRALQNGMYKNAEVPEEVVHQIMDEFQGKEAQMHSLLEEKDPASAKKIHPNDHYRILRALSLIRHTGEQPSTLSLTSREKAPCLWLKYAMVVSRTELQKAIEERTEKMLEAGLLNETQKLKENCPQARALNSVGYAEAVAVLEGRMKSENLKTAINEKTRQLAKRQLTWLRSDPQVRFIDKHDLKRVELDINNLKNVLEQP